MYNICSLSAIKERETEMSTKTKGKAHYPDDIRVSKKDFVSKVASEINQRFGVRGGLQNSGNIRRPKSGKGI